jgi:hypothetical protein
VGDHAAPACRVIFSPFSAFIDIDRVPFSIHDL